MSGRAGDREEVTTERPLVIIPDPPPSSEKQRELELPQVPTYHEPSFLPSTSAAPAKSSPNGSNYFDEYQYMEEYDGYEEASASASLREAPPSIDADRRPPSIDAELGEGQSNIERSDNSILLESAEASTTSLDASSQASVPTISFTGKK